eukprot:5620386-Prymnesium_polylepis.1
MPISIFVPGAGVPKGHVPAKVANERRRRRRTEAAAWTAVGLGAAGQYEVSVQRRPLLSTARLCSGTGGVLWPLLVERCALDQFSEASALKPLKQRLKQQPA